MFRNLNRIKIVKERMEHYEKWISQVKKETNFKAPDSFDKSK